MKKTPHKEPEAKPEKPLTYLEDGADYDCHDLTG